MQSLIKCEYVDLVDPKTLVHYSKNRNSHSKEQIDRLCKLIKHHGFRNPLIISKLSNQVIAGNGRLIAAIQMGFEKVPVIYQEFKNEDEEYTYSVSDNSIASWSELDLPGINIDMLDLGPDFDIDLLGIENFVLEPLEKFDEPEEKPEPKHKEADIKACPNCGVLIE